MYGNTSIPGTVLGQQPVYGRVGNPIAKEKPVQSSRPPEADLPRGLNYYADYSGCGHWRMIWPEQLLNAYQKCIIHGSSVMILDDRYYAGIKAVRIQRQATEQQLQFIKHLRTIADDHKFRLLYEIDDVCLREDIPDYNKFKFAFDTDAIRSTIIEMMELTDEMTVTCQFMKDYYASKTNHKNITVLPNYLPKFWIGRHYSRRKLENDFRENVKKPRILYAGSGAHFDVSNKVNQQDDFAHVNHVIRQTVDKYQWVFLGGYPQTITDLVRAGKIEFHPWKPLYDYPEQIYNLNINCMVAPLMDNNFNKAKSNLKYIEACAFGIPIVCQDMCTYHDAPYKFNTGDDMIDQIKEVLSGTSNYMLLSDRARAHADTMWLEDNIGCYQELYTTDVGDLSRKHLNALNGIGSPSPEVKSVTRSLSPA
tara:strand:+ start:2193 stop:3458 length:1266 start_codon:yes stop_codon:yes gene_type:complete